MKWNVARNVRKGSVTSIERILFIRKFTQLLSLSHSLTLHLHSSFSLSSLINVRNILLFVLAQHLGMRSAIIDVFCAADIYL
jgi:hypothetical protein